MTATENGKPARKQLSDQLDRLDAILDVLADGLPQAVRDACQEGTRLAVKDAVVELLTNPDLRAALAGLAPPPAVSPPQATSPPPAADAAPPRPGLWTRTKARVRAAKEAVTRTARGLSAVMPVRKILLVGLGVGVVVGVVAAVAPHGLAAAAAGVGGAVAAVAAQAARWLRKATRPLSLDPE